MPNFFCDQTCVSSLIQRARSAEPQAWQMLLHLYSPCVYQWCRQQGLSANDAARLTQSTFQAVWEDLQSFPTSRRNGSFRDGLSQLVAQALRSTTLSGKSCPSTRVEALLNRAWSPTNSRLDTTGIMTEMFGLLKQRALDVVRMSVETTTWEIFKRSVLLGESATTVADSMGLATWTVRQARYQVLFRMRTLLLDQ